MRTVKRLGYGLVELQVEARDIFYRLHSITGNRGPVGLFGFQNVVEPSPRRTETLVTGCPCLPSRGRLAMNRRADDPLCGVSPGAHDGGT